MEDKSNSSKSFLPLWGSSVSKPCKNSVNKWAKLSLPKSDGSSQSLLFGASNIKISCERLQLKPGLSKPSTRKICCCVSSLKAPQFNAAKMLNRQSSSKWSRTALSWFWTAEEELSISLCISCCVKLKKSSFVMSWFLRAEAANGDPNTLICTLKSFWKSSLDRNFLKSIRRTR